MADSTSSASSERSATGANNHTPASADAQTSPRQRKAFPLRFLAGALAHWQIIASAVLLGGGVAGLAATYDDYCGMTELSYAPAALRSDFEEGSKVAGFRPGVMAAQIETESHWRVGVVSHQGAKGIAQFTDDAWSGGHYSFGNGWCSCGWYGSVPGRVGFGFGCGRGICFGFCECFGSSVCERFCGIFDEAFGDELGPLGSAFLGIPLAYIATREYSVLSIVRG